MPTDIPTEFDDETLMAFADGRTDPATSAAIETALETDAALADRVAAFVDSRNGVRDLYAPLADLPVPPDLEARVRAMAAAAAAPGDRVVPFPPRRTARRPAWFVPAAAAAALAAVVAGPAGFLLAPGAGTADVAVGADLPADLAGVVATAASGAEAPIEDGRLRVIATFRDAAGQLCREIEVDRRSALVAVTCRSGETWRTVFAVEAPLDGGYAPASSMAALDAWLVAVDAGEPLEPADEAAALAEKKSSGPSE